MISFGLNLDLTDSSIILDSLIEYRPLNSASVKGFLVFIVALSACLLAYFPLLRQADNALPMSGEDAYKNYYTLAYYLNHNPASLHFEGMNYPFGEHLLYTDNQPIMAMLLKGIHSIIPIGSGLPFLMLFLVLLSCAAGAWALYRIVKESGAPWWMNALLCSALVLLSPQLQRMSGHYSLAYVGFIPLVFWVDYCFSKKPDLLRGMALAFSLFALAFVHPYLLVMMAGIVLPGQLVQHFLKRESSAAYLKSLAVTLLPIIAFQAVMSLTDSVPDRPANPYGFLVYKASIESVFLPIGLPYFSDITSWLSDYLHPSEEGFFYLGLASILALALMLFQRFARKQTLRLAHNEPEAQSFIYSRCIGALPVLILALGLPFAIKPLDEFLPLLGPLRQFRGIGRFVFTVYFAFGLNLLWLIGNHYQRWQHSRKRGHVLFVATLSFLLLFEAANYQRGLLKSLLPQFTNLDIPELSMNASEFQCIYPLPYYHIGSELFRTKSNQAILRKSLELSLASGLPLNSVQMSRTSQGQTIQQFDLTTEINDVPHLLDQYSENKPILLVHTENETLSTAEQKLVAKASEVGAWNGLKLYQLDTEAWEMILAENIQFVKEVCEPDSEPAPNGPIGRMNWGKEGPGTHGTGALTLVRSAQNDLLTQFHEESTKAAGSYVLSFWIDASMPQSMNTQLLISELKDGESLQYELFEVTDRIVMVDATWTLIEIPFVRKKAGSELQIILYRDGDDVNLHLQDLMLRYPADNVCVEAQRLNLNNRFFEPSKRENVPLQSN